MIGPNQDDSVQMPVFSQSSSFKVNIPFFVPFLPLSLYFFFSFFFIIFTPSPWVSVLAGKVVVVLS